MSNKFKVDQEVVCTWGINKNEKFVIKAVIKGEYSCKLADKSNDRYYRFDDDKLELSV